MKVLIISHTYVAAVNQQKLRTLAKYDDLELVLLVPRCWKGHVREILLEKDKDKRYRIVPTRIYFNGHLFTYFYSFITLLKLLLTFRPDIVHIELEPPSLSAFQVTLLAKLNKGKVLFFTWENIFKTYGFLKSFVEQFVLKYSDYAIAGNKEARDNLRRKGFKKRVKVLPQLGINPGIFRKTDVKILRQRLGLNSFTIGYVGRLVEEKGILTLVKAASRLKTPFNLLIVGRGPLKSKIVSYAKELGVGKLLTFIDAIPHSQVPVYINCLDALVLPSLTTGKWKEQFGHILVEAMTCEVPVIGSDSGEIPNVIGDAGLIFKEKDYQDLVGKLLKLMTNHNYRTELVKKGKQRVLQNYTWERIARETFMVYQDLMSCS